MTEKTCGNCANHEIELDNGPLVKCNGDLTVCGWKDRRDSAKSCPYYKAKWPKRHLRMWKVVATHHTGVKDPFNVAIFCTDGHVYDADSSRVMQARCAGWKDYWRHYGENGEHYDENVWTGPVVPVVVTELELVR